MGIDRACSLLRRRTLAVVAALAATGAVLALLASGSARADLPNLVGGFQLQSSQLFVHENAGAAVITVERSAQDAAVAAQVRYITIGGTAVAPFDYTPVKGELDFAPGEQSKSFSMPIVDHGTYSLPKTIQVSLFGAHSTPMGDPSKAVLTILDDDPPAAHIANNPLGLASASGGNPLAGATFFVDHRNEPSHAARRFHAVG